MGLQRLSFRYKEGRHKRRRNVDTFAEDDQPEFAIDDGEVSDDSLPHEEHEGDDDDWDMRKAREKITNLLDTIRTDMRAEVINSLHTWYEERSGLNCEVVSGC